ncbi:MAG TPA: DUF126 domain-containing protein [Geobacterales bacterium]|nr:DUF126 domain-containing protein [Geobacterales bacterium]
MNCKSIIKGFAKGIVLKTERPINLLMLNDNGILNDAAHILNGKSVANRVLVFPYAVGSSVGAYRLYNLRVNKNAPNAIICLKPDLITVSGCAIANIPLVVCSLEDFKMIKDGIEISVDADKGEILF